MMGIFTLQPSKKKLGGPSLLCVFRSLIFVSLLGFFGSMPVLASSHSSVAASFPIGTSRSVDFAQVSVVRLIATYQSQAGKSLAQCTGLGVMIASWASEGKNDQNNWVLTDGSLVNPGQPSCLPTTSGTSLTLARVDIYFNTVFNPAMVPAIPVAPISVHCLVSACNGGLALLSFATGSNQTFPHVDLANTNLAQDMALALHLPNASGPDVFLPGSSNTNEQVRDQYVKEAQRFLTPQQANPGDANNLEAGTPIFNQAGELTAVESGNKTTYGIKNLAAVINALPDFNRQSGGGIAPPVISPVHNNLVYEDWKTGINNYYQGDFATARSVFQKAGNGNALFQTPLAFEQLISSRLAKNNGTGQQGSSSSISVRFFGVQLTIPDKNILILTFFVFLSVLFLFVFIVRNRLLRRRRMLKEYTEAERRAELEARRIAAMEEAQNQKPQWMPQQNRFILPENVMGKQPLVTNTIASPQNNVPLVLPAQQTMPFTKPMPNSTPDIKPELHCPRCSAVVPKSATYCPSCRLQLIAPEPVRQLPAQPIPMADRMPLPVQPQALEKPPSPIQSSAHSLSEWPVADKSSANVEPARVPGNPVQEKVPRTLTPGATTYIGQRLGNYRIKSLLGHGGFADVYLGEHVFLKTHAAVKVLHTRLTTSDLMKRFVVEARTIVGLNHPHIIRVLEFGVEGNEPDLEQSSFNVENSIPFLIMDYAPGGTLRGRYPKGTRVPLPQVIYYVKQVAAALQYAHGRKLIHRDVKPENMLLSQQGDLLLSDFGIVAVAHSEHSINTQEMAGTISYMAPEQIKGRPHPASDQYALAVVVYEWLSGMRPFQGDNQWEIMNQHLSSSPKPLRERMPSLPPGVDDVVLKALAKTPAQRFENIIAFADALEQATR